MTTTITRSVGTPISRVDGDEKVRGAARYAFEAPVERPAYLHPLQAPIAKGRITSVDVSAALSAPGVLAVFTHENAPALASGEDPELTILQSDEVSFRGQFVGGVVADSSETARHAASLVRMEYAQAQHDSEFRADRDDLYAPDQVNPWFDTDTEDGDVDAALASAPVAIDATYTTPYEHNNPLEPHSTVAIWARDELTLYDSTQGGFLVRAAIAGLFGLDPQRVRVISPHVGGGFGAKTPHAHLVLTVMAAKLVASRPVKLALTRHQMFSLVGYRTPTIQRLRLGADTEGHLTAISHDVIVQTAKFKEFAEQAAIPTRMMYACPNRRTTHRLAALDVPPPTFMRAPGEAPGMYALECAMDETAVACGMDPIEFRVRNEPSTDPESGLPYSSRNLVSCLREGAQRFGWHDRDPEPGTRREDGWLTGTGVASSTFPVIRFAASATIRVTPEGRYSVLIGAVDIGTGTWTALRQIAADALEIPFEDVDLHIGDTALPPAGPAGGSTGITTWGSAVINAAAKLREQLPAGTEIPAQGLEVTADDPGPEHAQHFSMHSFGAQFAEVWVHEDTGEIRVPRMLGVFAAGRIINPKTARSQMLGGMTMGLSMALHEEGFHDPRFGHVVTQDFAEYHISTNADIGAIDVEFIDEDDPYVNALGAKGIGELGIVGTAAAIANAAYHATGVRVRDLPITLDNFLR